MTREEFQRYWLEEHAPLVREHAGAALLEDERRFIDHSRSPIFLAEEHEVIASL